MAKVERKQPSEEKTFDIDLSPEMKRSDEVVTAIISFVDDQATSMTYTSPIIIGPKALRVTLGSGIAALYKITIKFATNYSPILEADCYFIVAET